MRYYFNFIFDHIAGCIRENVLLAIT